MKNKLTVITIIIISVLVTVRDLRADDFAFSAAPWNFSGSIEQGQYAGAGIVIGGDSYFELEGVLISEITPAPANTVLGGVLIGISLLGDRNPGYFNVVLSGGYLHGISGLNSGGEGFDFSNPEHNDYLILRISPLAIGNSYYGMRERIFSAGIYYDIQRGKTGFVWSWLILDKFF